LSKNYFILFVLIFLLTKVSVSQQKDFIGLSGFSVSKQLSRSLDISISEQVLFNQNLSEFWIGFGDFSVGLKLNKHINTELHYRRITIRGLNDNFENRNLLFHTLSYSKSFGKFSFSLRNRIQQLVYGEYFSDNQREPRWYNRDKLNVRYRFNYYWSTFVATEVFVPLNHPRREGIDQARISCGLVYQFNDYFRIESYYQIQQQLNRVGNDSNYLLGVNAMLRLK
jgi:Protein of unknown function (DUF2490)